MQTIVAGMDNAHRLQQRKQQDIDRQQQRGDDAAGAEQCPEKWLFYPLHWLLNTAHKTKAETAIHAPKFEPAISHAGTFCLPSFTTIALGARLNQVIE